MLISFLRFIKIMQLLMVMLDVIRFFGIYTFYDTTKEKEFQN